MLIIFVENTLRTILNARDETMKLILFLLPLLPIVQAGRPVWVGSDLDDGGPADSCTAQQGCVKFNHTLVHQTVDPVCADECYYRICMILNTSHTACAKDGAISHFCDYGDVEEQCLGDYTLADASAQEGAIHEQCLNVMPNETAYFILKDGSNCSDSVDLFTFPETGTSASCYPRDIYTESCSGNAVGMECVWEVKAPASANCVSDGGAAGDPRIRRWNRKSFEFHGECDLVLVHSDHVNDNKVLDVHIRTVIHEWWSQIDSAALCIGDVILQVDTDKLYLNGKEILEESLPVTTEEFVLSVYEGSAITEAIHKKKGEEVNVLKTFAATLNDHSVVTFKIVGGFLNVAVKGSVNDFEHATGLMGDFKLGKPYNRKGERMYDLEEFSFEWQVDPSIDPTLFIETKGPQLPHERCRMPDVAKTSRKLSLEASAELLAAAEQACSGKEEFDACLADVLATGNVHLALIHD